MIADALISEPELKDGCAIPVLCFIDCACKRVLIKSHRRNAFEGTDPPPAVFPV